MIFDRTKNDVDAAIQLREEKVKTFKNLTEEDIAVLERGMMTINTLNRIEQKQIELKSAINDMGYWDAEISNKYWQAQMIFNSLDFKRIVENTKLLKAAFFEYKNTPKVISVSYHYENINSIEKILFDIDQMINEIKLQYRECGDFICGEV
jgi:hypothetical protein